jgi:very-short-patch-repair endonuclease
VRVNKRQQVEIYAQRMRDDPTKAEMNLRSWLLRKKVNFAFQKVIEVPGRTYIADFYFPAARLIVEIDGGYHQDPLQAVKDDGRDAHCLKAGYNVLRFSNQDALWCVHGVIKEIQALLDAPPRHTDVVYRTIAERKKARKEQRRERAKTSSSGMNDYVYAGPKTPRAIQAEEEADRLEAQWNRRQSKK